MFDDHREKLLTDQAKHELFLRLCERGDAVWKAVRSSADDLRALGLEVATHYDYRLGGERHTFWLMTYRPPRGPTIALKGEGKTDMEALDKIRAQFAELTDDHHHAPCCPANHYHGQRAPTGRCTCGAAASGTKMTDRPAGFVSG